MNKIKIFRGKCGSGKTWALLLQAILSAHNNKKVAFMSREVSEDFIIKRIYKICKHLDIDVPGHNLEICSPMSVKRLIFETFEEIYIDNFSFFNKNETIDLVENSKEYEYTIYSTLSNPYFPHSVNINTQFITITDVIEKKDFKDSNEYFETYAFVENNTKGGIIKVFFEDRELDINIKEIMNMNV